MAAAFDIPFCEQPPSPQTKIGNFSFPFRSAGLKMVPFSIPGEQLVSTITVCGPLPDTFAPVGCEAAQAAAVEALPAVPCAAAVTLYAPPAMPSIPTRSHIEDIDLVCWAQRMAERDDRSVIPMCTPR